MSNFFDRVKRGVSDTSTKTKIMIETNKLKNQISQEKNRIQGLYREIGKKVFEAYEMDKMNDLEDLVDENCLQIIAIQDEIENLELNIEELNNSTDDELPADVIEPTPETLSEPIDANDNKDTHSIPDEEPLLETLPDQSSKVIVNTPEIPDIPEIETSHQTIEEIVDEVEIKANLGSEEIETDRMMKEAKTDLERIVEEVEAELEDEETIEEEMILTEHRCTNCNSVLEPQAKFCMNCGTPVTNEVDEPALEDNRCPSCNGEVNPGARFCRHCGSPL